MGMDREPTAARAGATRRAVVCGAVAVPVGAAVSFWGPVVASVAPSGMDPVVVAYQRLRRVEALLYGCSGTSAEREAAGRSIPGLERTIVATPATSPAGIAAKLKELVHHMGWFAEPHHYETRLCRSALDDLERMGGRA